MVVYSLGTGTAILLPSARSKRRLAATLTGNKAAVAFAQVIIKDEGVLVRLVNYEGYLSIAAHLALIHISEPTRLRRIAFSVLCL